MEAWQEILNQGLVMIGGAVLSLAGYGLTKLTNYLSRKTDSERARLIITRSDDVVIRVVRSVFQKYVRPLKALGPDHWNAETQQTALDSGVDEIKSYLGAKGLRELSWMLGFSDATPEAMNAATNYIAASIENAVVESKNAGKKAANPPPAAPAQG